MSSSFWLLGVESHDFSQAEKERTACKAEQIHKLTTIFTQNDNLGPFWVKTIVILWICSALQVVLSFSVWEKSRDSTPNCQKTREHVEHIGYCTSHAKYGQVSHPCTFQNHSKLHHTRSPKKP